MYDDQDYDHRSRDRNRDERDHYRRRSPASRDGHQYRSRHDSSRSPRRTPPRGPRGEESYRDQGRSDRYGYSGSVSSDRSRGAGYGERYDREQRHHASDATYDDRRYRRRESPGYGREGRSPDRGRERDYRSSRDTRDRGRRSPRDHTSPDDSADDGYHRESLYRQGPGRPYHTIKMDDIPENMGSHEVDEIMRGMGAMGLVEVRIKSDDRGGDRRCYAFAEFSSEDESIEFLEKHFPAFEFIAADGTHVRVPIAYSRERRQAVNPDDWQCTMAVPLREFLTKNKLQAVQGTEVWLVYHSTQQLMQLLVSLLIYTDLAENPADMQLDGKSDECPQQTPSQFMVIRNLPASVNEHVLATGVKKLYLAKDDELKQPQPAAPSKLKSTAPVGNTTGLGAKPGSLTRVFLIRDRYSEASCRYGFAEFSNLDDARAAMAKYNATPQFTISSKPVTVAYIHSGVFIPYFKPIVEKDRKLSFAATHNPTLRLSYWNPTVYASEFGVFSESLYEDKASGKPGTESNLASAKDSKKRKAEKDLAAPGGKKVIAMAPQLQMWATKHAELRGAKDSGKNGTSTEKDSPATGVNSLGASTTQLTSSAPSVPGVSYADLDRMCCLLCRRKFISEPSLRRHEQFSDMHKTNLADDARIEKAAADLKAIGKEPMSNYRDRAKERRMVHKQPTKPKVKAHLPRKNAQKESDAPSKDSVPSKPAMSKGAGLLAKMGWNTGTGLGAEGTGRTNIIETMAYTPGVGLGAEGGKIGDAAEEASRATTNNYSDFVAKAKDKARERYEKMS